MPERVLPEGIAEGQVTVPKPLESSGSTQLRQQRAVIRQF